MFLKIYSVGLQSTDNKGVYALAIDVYMYISGRIFSPLKFQPDVGYSFNIITNQLLRFPGDLFNIIGVGIDTTRIED